VSIPDRLEPPVASSRWRRARNEAANLAQLMHGATWPERAQILDRFLWYEARAGLSSDQITSIIGRQPSISAATADLEAHLRYTAAVVSGVLGVLGEVLPVDNAWQAATLLLSDRPVHREAAEEWLEEPASDLLPALAELPGHAFTLLALHRNDTAISFIARDAFRMTLLGQH
jgi:hypothetical protein